MMQFKIPGLKRGRFGKAIDRIRKKEDEFYEDLGRCGVIPDFYKVCNFCKTITAYEIEDSSKMDMTKLKKYGWIYGALDDICWNLIVAVVDRYGENITYLNPEIWYFLNMGEWKKEMFLGEKWHANSATQ